MLMRAPIVLSALVSIMLAPVSSVQAQPRSSAEITRILDIYLRGCIDKADGSLRVYIPRLVLAGVSPRDDVLARQCDLRREVEVIFRPARDGEDGSSALGPGTPGPAGPPGPPGTTGSQGEQGPTGAEGAQG
jgi:hypothetical protein